MPRRDTRTSRSARRRRFLVIRGVDSEHALSTATDVALLEEPERLVGRRPTELNGIEFVVGRVRSPAVEPSEAPAPTNPHPYGRDNAEPSLLRLHQLLADAQPLTWMLIGDSYEPAETNRRDWRSFGGRLSEFVRSELGRSDDVFIVNTVPGQSVATLAGAATQRVLRFRPDCVLVSIGARDVQRGSAGLIDFERSVGNLVATLRDAGIVVILCTPPPMALDMDADAVDQLVHIEAVRAIAAEYGAPLVDHFVHWETAAKEIGGLERWFDHESAVPGRVGHEQMTRRIIDDLQLDAALLNRSRTTL